jgi:hypothetical protein
VNRASHHIDRAFRTRRGAAKTRTEFELCESTARCHLLLSSARRFWRCAILDSRLRQSHVHSLCANVVAADAREEAMLYTIAVVLFILWLLGLVSGYTVGAFIHVLLVIALVLVVVQFVSSRRVV